VFELNIDGTAFSVSHHFDAIDGANPSDLVISSNTLYGATSATVFKMSPDGKDFTNLHVVTEANETYRPGLLIAGNNLYGISSGQGSDRILGVYHFAYVFRVNTDGTGWTNIYTFIQASGFAVSALVLSGNNLYGAVYDIKDPFGYPSVSASAFALQPGGTGFTTVHRFEGYSGLPNTEGNYPSALVVSDNALYGTAAEGGSSGSGTIFIISFKPQLAAVSTGLNLSLSWPTSYAGFDYAGYTLESTTDLGSSAWTTVSPAPAVANGQKTVTIPISSTQRFFRLRQ
jgi:uncharacterized repeat protein (TIGR03803 family)